MNEEKVLNGQGEDPLSEEGKEQVRKLAERFARIPLDEIRSSDLSRTKDTAQGIINTHPTLNINRTDARLRERGGKDFDGLTYQDVDKLARDQGMSRGEYSEIDPRVEHSPEIIKRFFDRYDEHIKDSGHNAVGVVSHGATIRIILAHLAGMTPWDYLNTHKGIENTGVSIISINNEGRRRIITTNDFSHLGYTPDLTHTS